MNLPSEPRLEPLEDQVGDLFVNRQEELALFLNDWIARINVVPNNSWALIGRRRTGKTSVLVKLYNYLFYQQERVIPVYISFARFLDLNRPLTMQEVGDHYMASYLLSFLAFRYRRPELMRFRPTMDYVKKIAPDFADPIVDEQLFQFDTVSHPTTIGDPPAQVAINAPRYVAGVHNLLTAVIVDEFQVLTDVYDPIQKLSHDLTDSFQLAVDTRVAPMLVSGSAVSLLVHRALTGMLQGRFGYHYLKPLAREHAYELVFRVAAKMGMSVNEEFAESIWQLTGGFPYTIQTILLSQSPARSQFPALDALQAVVLFEIGTPAGRLWQHYHEEFDKVSHALNEGTTTRKVMFWATKYPDQRIDVEQVAQRIGVDESKVRESLEKLRWIDVVEKIGLLSYKGPTDPMMRRYIEYQHYTEIEKLGAEKAIASWQEEMNQIRGRLSHALGEIGELYARMVMASFAGQTVDGSRYFNLAGPVLLPKFDRIERRGGLVQAGKAVEIDVLAEWRVQTLPTPLFGIWLVEAKYTQERIDADAVKHFLQQTEQVQAQGRYVTIVRWFFSKSGFTQPAEQLLKEAGVLYCDWQAFLAFSHTLGFFGLPTG
ncbi:MAG: hypothetical protein DYG89_06880 [Caldilinea sp. CFX5]|nr:hypothetical protein [Caldilinea sp. CFX5]